MRHLISIIIALAALTAPAIGGNDHTYGDFLIHDGDDYDYLTLHGETDDGYASVDMTGGYVYDLFVTDSVNFTMTGGKISDFYTHDTSSTTITAGQLGSIISYDEALVNIEGGSLSGTSCKDSTVTNISGGLFTYSVNISDSATMNISGGEFPDRMIASDSSIVNIFAGNIEYDPNSLYIYSSWSGIEYWKGGKITGNWADGTYFEIQLVDRRSGQGDLITFNHFVLHELTQPKVIYVDDDANGANNGTSWTDAFNDLQDALKVATAFDQVEEIRVAQGTYKPALPDGPRTASFHIPNGVKIKGSYAGAAGDDPDARDTKFFNSCLNGDLLGNDTNYTSNLRHNSRWENVYHVVTTSNTDETTVLDGFKIRGGQAYDNLSSDNDNGGGIFNDSGSPTIVDCFISYNAASNQSGGGGGGMYNRNGQPKLIRCRFRDNQYIYANDDGGGAMCNNSSSPVLEDCDFSSNESEGYGGAVFNYYSNPEFIRCVFIHNDAEYCGGAVQNVDSGGKFTDCRFGYNKASQAGGAIFNELSDPVLTGCLLYENVSLGDDGKGGAICNSYMDNPVVTDCMFRNNRSRTGGAIYSYHGEYELTDCFFEDNDSSIQGGAIYNRAVTARITHCLFEENSAKSGGAMYNFQESVPTIDRCVFRKNTATAGGGAIGNDQTSTFDISNSLFADNTAVGGGAIENDDCKQRIKNCTFVNNTAEFGAIMYNDENEVWITNCILWGNRDSSGANNFESLFNNSDVDIEFKNSCLEDWERDSASGNIGTDPMFVDSDNGDYHLLPDSPCVNKGDNSVVGQSELDFAGNERIFNKVVDMGAYESGTCRVFYVDDDASGADNGSSWQDAFNDLQEALALAKDGDEIHVAQGTYTPAPAGGSRSESFNLKGGVKIKGGYAGTGAPDPGVRGFEKYETILSGDLNGDDGEDFTGYDENSYHVLVATWTVGPMAFLEGCTITAGYANGEEYNNKYDNMGAGIWIDSTSPVLTHCRFIANWANRFGGVMRNYRSSPKITDCLFKGNRSDRGGGVMVNGGKSIPLIVNCSFIANRGGVMHNDQSGTITVINCLFAENSAYGSSIASNDDCNQRFINSTFVNNTSEIGILMNNDENYVSMTNCILWGNRADNDDGFYSQFVGGDVDLSFNNCFMEGYPTQWNGNITGDPLFVDPDNGDYRLQPNSPCINKGDNSAVEPEMLDLDGNPRIINDIVDMGAYEASESFEVALHVMPSTINRRKHQRRILAIIYLPADIAGDDIDTDTPLVMQPGNIPAIFQRTTHSRKPIVLAMFDTTQLLTAIDNKKIVKVKVSGQLKNGQTFTGTDTIKIISKSNKQKPKSPRKSKPAPHRTQKGR